MIDTKKITFRSQGPFGMINITKKITDLVRNGQIENGMVNIYSHGSTTGIVILGSEEGVIEDFVDSIKRIVPDGHYLHDDNTDPDHGVAHIRSAITGTGVTIPFNHKRMYLGMFQQVFFVDYDLYEREREIIVQILGE